MCFIPISDEEMLAGSEVKRDLIVLWLQVELGATDSQMGVFFSLL